MPPKKPKLGQNFLIDDSACLRIAESLGDVRERTVIEIGPGHGAITSLLAERCRRLHCVEFDPALARELAFRFRNDPHVTIHAADVLKTDLAALLAPEEEHASLDVIGNLPYYITSDILLHLFAAAREGVLHRAVLMMQREVAERVTAPPGSSEYGALSAATQMHANATTLFTLPPSAFSPPPDVYSSVVRLEFAPRFAELGVDAAGFNRFLRAAFAQKRKTLRNNLRVAGLGAPEIEAAWPRDLSAQVRAEAVSLEDMASLYRALYGSSGSNFAEATEPGS
jgi:16S rRNA (adenine1518-N6/adenine1519-N6)-dimethyltransferase